MMLDKNNQPLHLRSNEEIHQMIQDAIEDERTNRERAESIEKFKPGITLEWDKVKATKIMSQKKDKFIIKKT